MTFSENSVNSIIHEEIGCFQVNVVEENGKDNLQRESRDEAKVVVVHSSMDFDEQDWALSGDIRAMVENCLFSESIQEFDVNFVSMEELCATHLSTPCVKGCSIVREVSKERS